MPSVRVRLGATAVLVVALCLPVPGGSATTDDSVEPTCHGQTATLIGVPGEPLVGTDAADVIVTNGARYVRSRLGNDSICVTGMTGWVAAGGGADHVDTTGGVASGAIMLDGGADTFVGGSAADLVNAGPGADVINTNGGDDVYNEGLRTSNTDQVSLGSGWDQAYTSSNLDGLLDGGPGRDMLHPYLPAQSDNDAWMFDNVQQVATMNGDAVLHWNSFQAFTLFSDAGTVEFRGSDAAESVWVPWDTYAGVGVIPTLNLGGGDDVATMSGTPEGVVNGGAGRDRVVLDDYGDPRSLTRARAVIADLSRDDVELGSFGGPQRNVSFRASGQISVPQVEDVTVSWFVAARLIGGGSDNRLRAWDVCTATLVGQGGADWLSTAKPCPDEEAKFFGVSRHVWMYGGSGDDVLMGRPRDDRLYGGDGHVSADGRLGRDLCVAETRINCET